MFWLGFFHSALHLNISKKSFQVEKYWKSNLHLKYDIMYLDNLQKKP